MAIVPLNQVWVDANFKEVQLRNIRIGQPVKLTADLYGRKVEYTGRVAGLGVGTGAAFALLPAQNATGNWIKVVQRVPVRIALDPEQLTSNPLRVGLSMDAEIDVTQEGRQDARRCAARQRADADAGLQPPRPGRRRRSAAHHRGQHGPRCSAREHGAARGQPPRRQRPRLRT